MKLATLALLLATACSDPTWWCVKEPPETTPSGLGRCYRKRADCLRHYRGAVCEGTTEAWCGRSGFEVAGVDGLCVGSKDACPSRDCRSTR